MEDLKEIVFNGTASYCPHCNGLIEGCGEVIETIDVEHIENGKYGVQARWKEVYVCPHCGKKYYLVCEH